MTSRVLSANEYLLAYSIFGVKIDYTEVRVNDSSPTGNDAGDDFFTPAGEINVPTPEFKIDFASASSTLAERGHFIHEMMHVWQHQNLPGFRPVIFRSAIETGLDPSNFNYDYDPIFNDVPFEKLTLEQQAEFVGDYYILLHGGKIATIKSNGGIIEHLNPTLEDYKKLLPSVFIGGTRDSEPDVTWDKVTLETGHFILTSETHFALSTHYSPLVLDLNSNGVKTTSLYGDDSIYFDLNHDGYAEATGWAAGGDGVLAIDLNADGAITNGSELFGDQTGYSNGFLALAAYDSNVDGKITSLDTQFGALRVWVDTNKDGYSQATELKTFSSLGITQINLAYTSPMTVDPEGNTIKQLGTFIMNGNSHDVADVYFKVDKVNTLFQEDYELDMNVFALPNLRGYGLMPDLRTAMSLDKSGTGNLMSKVTALSTLDFVASFVPTSVVTDAVRSIMFRWAGVENVVPNQSATTNYADDREIAFLEHLTGDLNPAWTFFGAPNGSAYQLLNQAFEDTMSGFYARLMAQGAGKELFTGDVSYNYATDSLEGITGLNSNRLNDLQNEAAGLLNSTERAAFWSNVVRMIEYTIGTDHLTAANRTTLNNAIHSDASLTLAGIKIGLVEGSLILNGTNNKIGLLAQGGDDRVYGTTGNDFIDAGDGNDLVSGRDGNDDLNGNGGNDTFLYNQGDGNDLITGGLGIDRIVFGPGIKLSNISFTRLLDNNLLLTIGGDLPAQIVVKSQFTNGGSTEFLEFIDGTTFNLFALNYTLYGTALGETMNGAGDVGGPDDTLYGLDGADTLNGGNGNDHLYGGDGNDYIYGGADNDYLEGGTGDDYLEDDSGNDIYYYSGGHDTINEGGGGIDTLVLGNAYKFETNLGISQLNSNMEIQFDPTNFVTIYLGATTADYPNKRIENLALADGFSLKLSAYANWLFTSASSFNGDNNNAVGIDLDDTIIGHASANNIKGYDGDDRIYGSGGNDTLYGLEGSDLVHGGDGNDIVRGGNGDDAVWGGDGDDDVRGEAGNDILNGGAGRNYLQGGDGDDIIYAGNDGYNATVNGIDMREQSRGNAGDDTIHGGTGVDSIYGGSGDDVLYGNDGDDFIYGDDGDDEMHGGQGNDNLQGLEGQDSLWGDAGNDTIRGGLDSNVIYGGDGDDIIYGGTSNADPDQIAGNDELYGDAGNDTLSGGFGADFLDGGDGNDTMYGNAGSDDYIVSRGADYISDSGGDNDKLVFGPGIDFNDLSFSTMPSNADNLLINWGAGHSIEIKNQAKSSSPGFIEKIAFDDGSIFALNTYGATGNPWSVGSSAVNTLTGTSAANTILGNAGNDVLNGGAGNDQIHGGDDNDALNGGDNDDLLHGGSGNDTLNGDNGNDTLWGGSGSNDLNGGAGDDTYVIIEGNNSLLDTSGNDKIRFNVDASYLTFQNTGVDDVTIRISTGGGAILVGQRNSTVSSHFETIIADSFELNLAEYANWKIANAAGETLNGDNYSTTGIDRADVLLGQSGNDTLKGFDFADQIHGGAGNDILYGGTGNDLVHGGTGNDTVRGEDGNDSLWGGDGTDDVRGGGGNDVIHGGAGDDIYLRGEDGDDIVYGDDGNDIVRGDIGNDELHGGTGDDDARGGDGNDLIFGDDGMDTIYGEAGMDVLHGGFGADNVHGGADNDIVYGDSGEDFLYGDAGIDTLYGGAGRDTIYGGTSTGDVTGDTDYLFGDDGDDFLRGGIGDDFLQGDAGADKLYGDAGTDTFVFKAISTSLDAGIDTIDFSTAQGDKLDLHDVLDAAFNPGTHAIGDFVSFANDTTGGSAMSVDLDGTGSTYAFEQVATLSLNTNIDVNSLYANGNLLVA